MEVGLIDVDNRDKLNNCFPNLALMKLSSWHKKNGDSVQWYEPLEMKHYDKVYMSKVFSFTEDYPYYVNADEVIRGGTGYCIDLVDGREVYDKTKDKSLPYEVEHSFPDYGLYGITDTAYGFMSRGCPRGCDFCHVKSKEGLASIKVADLCEFWNGQRNIELLDPNTLACKDWKDILHQLIDSKAYVNMNQGVDIRLMNEERADMLRKVKLKAIHFAYDRFQDKEIIEPRFRTLKEVTGWDRHKVTVYVLCGFDTTMEQNLDRIMFLRSLDFQPYVMLYDKEHIPVGHELRRLQRWVNSPFIFWKCNTFNEYKKGE